MIEDKKILDKIKSIDSGTIMLLGVIGMIVSAFSSALAETGNLFLFVISLAIPIVSCIIFIVGAIRSFVEKQNNKNKIIENVNTFQSEYDAYIEELGVKRSDLQVTLSETAEKTDTFPAHIPHYLWIDNDMLNLFPMANYYIEWEISSIRKPDVSKLKIKSIPLDSILYFEEVGELRKYTTVSGGGTSLKGALLGYAIAEDVGAIIGSRESITTNVVSEDDRTVELIYKNQERQIENLEFKHDAYDVLKKLMPLKELRKMVSLNMFQDSKDSEYIDTQIHQTVKDKLRQLKELRYESLITEEEFIEQKKKILEAL